MKENLKKNSVLHVMTSFVFWIRDLLPRSHERRENPLADSAKEVVTKGGRKARSNMIRLTVRTFPSES
jgi:hypothetical protein